MNAGGMQAAECCCVYLLWEPSPGMGQGPCHSSVLCVMPTASAAGSALHEPMAPSQQVLLESWRNSALQQAVLQVPSLLQQPSTRIAGTRLSP